MYFRNGNMPMYRKDGGESNRSFFAKSPLILSKTEMAFEELGSITLLE
jgi:hypothetical protein